VITAKNRGDNSTNGVIIAEMGVITAKIAVIKANVGVVTGASGISRLFGAAKLQSSPGADNPRYAAVCT